MLKKIEILTQQDSEIKGFQANGYPEPRPRIRHQAEDDETEQVPVTRKPQVLKLLGQTPGQEWSVRQIAEALDIANHKSLRVTLDEMAKAGTLIKTPGARYTIDPTILNSPRPPPELLIPAAACDVGKRTPSRAFKSASVLRTLACLTAG